MTKAKITNNIKFPPMQATIKQSLNKIAKDIIIPILKEGILTNTDIRGKSFPGLSEATKRRKGHSRPLQDTGTLLTSFKRKAVSNNAVIVYISHVRNKIGEYLQIDGVGKSGKKFMFMGVTEGMESSAMQYMRETIAKWVRNANR